jgi:xanthine dehydrogenase large subunit
VSNTAFRGFGGPQGMLVIEQIIDDIARTLGTDALTVRRRNFYGIGSRNVTHYGQTVEDNVIHKIVERLAADAHYGERRQQIGAWNASSPIIKRGLALTPVKFGISFTSTVFNQAGALLHVYSDGTVLLNHGGTEMGQGLFTKIAQIVAAEFGLPLSAIRVSATDTAKVPNTSASAASSSADLNGKAAQAAAQAIRQRLVQHACDSYGVETQQVRFQDGRVLIGERSVSFGELALHAYRARISLSSTGYYRTPKIQWDKAAMRGRPFFYFAYGAAVSEVAVDCLTGETQLLRVDILHDAGELRTHAPSTYKIPTARDWPAAATVRLLEREPNREETIYRSKAVGEPPLMLAISVLHAIRDAVASCGAAGVLPELSAPATPEAVLRAIAGTARGAGT